MKDKKNKHSFVAMAGLSALSVAGFLLAGSSYAQDVPVACPEEPTDMPIAYGDIVDCSLGSVSDSDIFRWVGASNELVYVRTRGLTGGVEPCLTVFDSGGGVICNSACSASGQFVQSASCTLAADDTYTLVVDDRSADETGDYRLILERYFPASPTAQPIASFNVTNVDAIDVLNDLDFYTFDSAADETISIETVGTGGGVEPCISLYDPTGANVANSACSASGQFVQQINDLQLVTAGQYVIWIDDRSVDEAGTYELQVECLFGTCNTFSGRRHVDSSSLADFSGNGEPEIVELSTTKILAGGTAIQDATSVIVMDSATNTAVTSSFFYGDAWKAIGMTSLPDLGSVVAVLVENKSTGQMRLAIKDVDVDVILLQAGVFASNFRPVNISRVDDTDGDLIDEIGVLAVDRGTGAVRLRIVDPVDGSNLGTLGFPK